MSKIRWQPLEANPEVMSKYASSIGLSKDWAFTDVYSLELLDMVPQPCCAFILLFPITENYEKYCLEEKSRIEQNPQQLSDKVYFMKQTIGNACGTIGLLHSIANNRHRQGFVMEDSILKTFLDTTDKLSPEKRGETLERDEGICEAHGTSANEGQSQAIGADEKLDLHFVAIVNVDGTVYELDGRKPFPVMHGKCTDDNFMTAAADVCRKFMERDPGESRFSIIALAAKSEY